MNYNKLTDQNMGGSISIGEIHDFVHLIINSNNELQDTFWKAYSIHVLASLIQYLCSIASNTNEITLADCLNKLEASVPVDLLFEISVFGRQEELNRNRWANHERILEKQADAVVSILISTLKQYCEQGQFGTMFQ